MIFTESQLVRNGTILRTEDGGQNWKRVDRNLKGSWLYALTFLTAFEDTSWVRRGLILRMMMVA
jgi:photosystem II stability/assembly factor-like uncharacterized protein